MLMLPRERHVLTPAEMRVAEANAIAAGLPTLLLMERAAAAAALAIRQFCPRRSALVLCGPGNNGGDGYGVASALRAAGVAVRVAADSPPTGEPAATLAARWHGPVEPLASAAPAPLIIDALYGTGLVRRIGDTVQAAIDRLRDSAATVVAIDIASGVDALTGVAVGRPLAADLTVTFGAAKRGHILGAGRRLAGRLVVADIGVEVPAVLRLVGKPIAVVLPTDTHKFRRGSIVVIAGDSARGGAARLTALAALRTGAGLVTMIGDSEAPVDAIMRRSDGDAGAILADPRTSAIAIGPGLADSQRSRDWLVRVLAGRTPVVADAGALALAFGQPGEAALFAAATAPLVLTPHDGEFVRLFGPIGGDRISAVQAAAALAKSVVLLKGAETIIAAPDGRVAINIHASPWLATAGSGDVLTGIIAALLGNGLAPFEAAQAGAWLHGDAGIRGGAGLIADDIVALLPIVLGAL